MPLANPPMRLVSIHAPVRGATLAVILEGRARVVSIHAPVRGATVGISCSRGLPLFQSTPPCGGRPAD